ncbi:formimidoylglutamate deiminase [Chromatiales bacterium (ex Bugula neritina AB1)]|nr:formimidoylglutamate deiminase [Chromatiales bacterium (ex Bugula neritina AB1)]
MTLIHADQALLSDGWANDVIVGIASDGRIEYVERAAGSDTNGRTDQVPNHKVATLLPAPANAHSHTFQRAMAGLTERRGPDPRDSFWTWRRLMYRFLDRLSPDDIEAIAAYVQMEMLESGYATNVEFHYLHHQPGGAHYDSIAELSERIAAATAITGIGLTLLPVHYQYGGCDKRDLTEGQCRFGTDLDNYHKLWSGAEQALHNLPDDVQSGVAPHSLRAVAADSLPALLSIAPQAPFHMHIAEQIAEVEEVQRSWGARPVEWLLGNAQVDERWCLIHCTQMQSHETQALAKTGAVAGLCPITESSLGDGIFDGVAFLDADGRIAIGSDSNIRISLSEELRTLDYSQRLRDHSRAALATAEQSTGRRLYECTVAGGAQAAGRQCGKIAAGQWADLLALDGDHPDLQGHSGDTVLDTFIFAGDDRMVCEVWSAGRHQVTAGEHIHRQSIVERYRAVMKNLRELL